MNSTLGNHLPSAMAEIVAPLAPSAAPLSDAGPSLRLLPGSPTPSGYTVPAHRVADFARLSARHGWNTRMAVESTEEARSSLNPPCGGVTIEQAVAVLRRLWVITQDEFLRLGPRPVCRDTLRVLALAICSAATLREALDRFERFSPVFGGLPIITVTCDSGEATVKFGLQGFDSGVSLIVDTVLAVTQRAMNWATRRRVQLIRVAVPYKRPRGETDHDVLFGVPLNFGAPEAALTFASSDLSSPLVRRQDEIEGFLADIPSVLLSDIDFYSTHAQRVRGIVQRSLGDRACTADEIAACFGVSRQTLRRRLREEGTSVSAIKDDVLRNAALDSLTQGGETVSALAARLGFSEPSAFTRAFRRWAGESPSDFQRRRQHPEKSAC